MSSRLIQQAKSPKNSPSPRGSMGSLVVVNEGKNRRPSLVVNDDKERRKSIVYDNVDQMKERIKELELEQTKTDDTQKEIEKLRARIDRLEEENKKLLADKAELEGVIRQQGGDSGVMDAVQDCYARIDMRFDLNLNFTTGTNKKVQKMMLDLLHRYDWGAVKPKDDKMIEKMAEYYEIVKAEGGERQKRIDRKLKNRASACKSMIEALDKNPGMRDPALSLKQLKTVFPSIKVAYMSSDEETEDVDENTGKATKVLRTKRLMWESHDFAEAKLKLDAYYDRILNPSRIKNPIISIKDGRCNLSRRRLPPAAPKIVYEGY